MKLVLASTSAYRKMLLERLHVPFDTDRPETDETPLPGEAPAATAERLAAEKARAVAARWPGALIIGSDQVAEADGGVLMHCKHGSDRTGLMAAMYRIVVQGWSKEDALSEMTQGGFGDNKHFKDSIRYMMQADVDKLRTALANGDCSTSAFATCSMKSWFQTVNLK